jgi:hypothetical protein
VPRFSFTTLARMLRQGLVAGFVALALVLVAASGSAARTACTAGKSTVAGVEYESFCGPAKAKVNVAGKSIEFANGQCQTTPTGFTINIGSALLGTAAKPAKPYFGFDVGKVGGSTFGGGPASKDGTYVRVPVTFNADGTRYLVMEATVTLKHDRSAGSFRGNLLTGGLASGAFSC